MTMTADSVRGYESTRRWVSSRLSMWGDTGEDEKLLGHLAEFCEAVAKNPDEMVDVRRDDRVVVSQQFAPRPLGHRRTGEVLHLRLDLGEQAGKLVAYVHA